MVYNQEASRYKEFEGIRCGIVLNIVLLSKVHSIVASQESVGEKTTISKHERNLCSYVSEFMCQNHGRERGTQHGDSLVKHLCGA